MENLIPFNLERALAGDKVVTGDGRVVTQIFKLSVIPIERLVVVIDNRDYKYSLDGIWNGAGADYDYNTLFMASEPIEEFKNPITYEDMIEAAAAFKTVGHHTYIRSCVIRPSDEDFAKLIIHFYPLNTIQQIEFDIIERWKQIM